MDFRVDSTNSIPCLTFEKNTDLRTDIYFSLAVKKGGWFADLNFGSELFRVRKVTDGNMLLAHQYVLQALDWLKQTGRAVETSCVAGKSGTDSMSLDITVVQANSVSLFYKAYLDVRNGKISWQPVGV